MNELDAAIADATAAAGDGFVGSLLTRMGDRAGAAAVFGAPVNQQGMTVIPVARVKWGAGGGSGSATGEAGQSGEGGGGGAIASPAGFIELSPGGARFVPIRDPATGWPMILAIGVSAWLVLRGLRRLFR